MHCWGANLFWHGCNESEILSPQPIDHLAKHKDYVRGSIHPSVNALTVEPLPPSYCPSSSPLGNALTVDPLPPSPCLLFGLT